MEWFDLNFQKVLHFITKDVSMFSIETGTDSAICFGPREVDVESNSGHYQQHDFLFLPLSFQYFSLRINSHV